MEIFFNVNGVVTYFSPDKSIYLRHTFDDERRELKVWDAAVFNIPAGGNPSSNPVEVFQLPAEEYEQVKFFFQHYLPRNGMNINISEVWEDRERILHQTTELLRLSKIESDLNIRERRLKLGDAEEQITAYEQHKEREKPQSNLLEFPGGTKFKN